MRRAMLFTLLIGSASPLETFVRIFIRCHVHLTEFAVTSSASPHVACASGLQIIQPNNASVSMSISFFLARLRVCIYWCGGRETPDRLIPSIRKFNFRRSASAPLRPLPCSPVPLLSPFIHLQSTWTRNFYFPLSRVSCSPPSTMPHPPVPMFLGPS